MSTLGGAVGLREECVQQPVDVDGGGFKANGDTLGAPLPVKSGSR